MDLNGLVSAAADTITGLVASGPVAYLIVFLMSGLDVLLPIIPSEAIVLAAAVLAGSGTLDARLVVIAAASGAFLGDNVAHGIGRSMGPPVAARVLRGRMDRLDWMRTRLERHGPTLIITGRFLPGGRTLVAVGSGVVRMRWLEFAAFDAVAVVVWSLQVVIPGYIGGALFQDQPWIGFVVGAMVSLGVVATIEATRWLVRRRRGETLPPEMEDRVSGLLDAAELRLDGGPPNDDDDPAVDDIDAAAGRG